MKKQLIIAAVAATMSAPALADISITGAASATWTATDFDASGTANTNVYAQDTDITITGTHGDTTVSTSIDLNASGTTEANVGDITMATTLMGMDVTVTDDGGVIDFKVVTDIAGVTLTYDDSNAQKNGSVSAAMTIAGLDLTVKQAPTATTTTIAGTMGGITGTYENVSNDLANGDSNKIVVTADAMGMSITATSYQDESATVAYLDLDGDSAGASDSSAGTVIAATMDMGGNSVTVTSTKGTLGATTTENKLSIAGTRALASGADLTATYTNDTQDANNNIALKIAVSF